MSGVPAHTISWEARSTFEYQQEDNFLAEKIHAELERVFAESLRRFPTGQNLVGLFFVDLFKFIAGTLLRKRELDHGLVLDDPSLWSELKGWPYLGYSEILRPELVHSKKFGRKLKAFKPSNKHSVASALSRAHRLMRGGKLRVGVHPSLGESELVRRLILGGIEVKYFATSDEILSLPKLAEQFEFVKAYVQRVHRNVAADFDVELITDILHKHIFFTVHEGPVVPLPKFDLIIVTSGSEFLNRIITSRAQASGIPTAVIIHGDSFGPVDNQVFGQWEQGNANFIIGYGSHFERNRSRYKHLNVPGVRYIPGASVRVRSIRKETPVRKIQVAKKFHYCPTSLRGNQRRYGVYQELVDSKYLAWQRVVKGVFGNDLVIKAHPKDLFLGLMERFHGEKLETTDLFQLLDVVEVFIFDYVSTAFCYAAATDKPIVFLDLHIQSLGPDTLELLQRRCVYVDILENGLPSKSDLLKRLAIEDKDHAFVDEYSLHGKSVNRYDDFVKYLKELRI